MTIGERLRHLREMRGWNQKELAQRAGVSVGSITRYENGRNPRMPRMDVILNLAEALKVDPGELVNKTVSNAPSFDSSASKDSGQEPTGSSKSVNILDNQSMIEAFLANAQALTAIIQRDQDLQAQRLANEQERTRIVDAPNAEANKMAQETLKRLMDEQFPHSADFPGTSEVEATASGR